MLTINNLPDGRYFDGTYEWDKEGDGWTPLRAPGGMPTHPTLHNLKRVLTIHVNVNEPEWEYGREDGSYIEPDDYSKLTTHQRRPAGEWVRMNP